MTGATMLKTLKKGISLSYVDVTSSVVVKGSFQQPFECTACVFERPFRADDAIFKRDVDLRGSTFEGQVDMNGTIFEGPVLFVPFQDVEFRTPGCASRHRRHPEQDCVVVSDFQARASFSLATFEDVADFQSASFEMPIDYTLARFDGEADFSTIAFPADAVFEHARFSKAATFLDARFQTLVFEYVRSTGPLDFGNATFECTKPHDACQGTPPRCKDTTADCRERLRRFALLESSPDARFDYSVVDELSFTDTTFQQGAILSMSRLRASDLVLDPADIGHVAKNDQDLILGLIEVGAKSTNDLGVANEAHYRFQASKSAEYPWPVHALDYVFYRSIAGYLVEPLQPLYTLLALALLVSLLRQLLPAPVRRRLRVRMQIGRQAWSLRAGWRSLMRASRRRKGAIKGAWTRLCAYLHELLDTLILMWPGSGASQAGRRMEANVYRILFVCMLIGFANSNPTLRQMLDALR